MKGQSPTNDHVFSRQLLDVITASSFDFIGVVREEDRKLVYVNETGVRLFEYENVASFLNTYAPALRKDHVSPERLKEMDTIIAAKGFVSEEAEYVTKSGKTFWGHMQLNPFTVDGKNYLLVQIEKIDRARKAEETLILEQTRSGTLLDYASIGVVIVNQLQDILLVNPYGLQMFRYEPGELEGKKLDVLIPERYRQSHYRHHEKYFIDPGNRPMGMNRTLYALRKNGTEFPVEISLGTYRTEHDIFVIAFISDITKRRKDEEAIKSLNTELEEKVRSRTEQLDATVRQLKQQISETEAVEAELRISLEKEKELGELKSRFVSIASHEFRTPLSAILSSAYLVEKYVEAEDQPKRIKHTNRIISSVNVLTDILNDFLSVGKIEDGKIFPKYAVFNIKEHINGLIDEAEYVKKAGQEFIYAHEGDETVKLDAGLLKHVVTNLLSNAIKFSGENDSIVVRSVKQNGLLRISVQDNGIGIPEEDRHHLFERFYRCSNVSNIQGTGLGLHIVHKYTELMNGHVSYTTTAGSGTTFTLEFNLPDDD